MLPKWLLISLRKRDARLKRQNKFARKPKLMPKRKDLKLKRRRDNFYKLKKKQKEMHLQRQLRNSE